jgi:aspartate/methionine/tyrosine aminotransferase
MALHVSQRMLDVQTPMIPVVGEMIAANPGTISLGQGIVHYTPPGSVAAAVSAHADDLASHRYGFVSGQADLLDLMKQKLSDDNEITVGDDQRIIVTAGSNMAFQNTILAIADEGDEIIIMSPYYFNHDMAIAVAGCTAVVVPSTSEYQLDLAAVEAAVTDRTRAIVTISPNNPTGAVYSKEDLMAVNALCKARGIFHISDEAYEYFVYEDKAHFSAGSLQGSSKHTISLYSLSKAYGMAGWRVGYMLIPESLEVAVKKVQDTNLICPPIISQVAACAALAEGKAWIAEQFAGFAAVRELVLNELASLGDKVIVPTPHGAFYVLMKLAEERDDMELVRSLIEDYGVAVMPGNTFGVSDGTYLRIAYGALEKETVAEGMGRLVKGLNALL